MADLTVTPASVIPGANAVIERSGTAGATITAGQVVYFDDTTGKYKLADSDGAAALRSPRGIALNGASDGQPLAVQTKGKITIGATMTAGLAYYLSKVAGGIAPVADIASGGYATVLGIATSTTVLELNMTESGVAV
jgi:hypothetical protein